MSDDANEIQKILKSSSTMSMINHLQDVLEAIIDSIISKLGGMPFMLRYFFKILFEECSLKYKEEYGE